MIRFSAFRTPFGAALALGLSLSAMPVQAQDDAEVRIRALEAQVRALQRTVFPGGDGRFFEPQVDRGGTQSTPQAGTPATGAVTDILARLDTLESEIARLTSLVEEDRNDLRNFDSRLTALETGAAAEAREEQAQETATAEATIEEPEEEAVAAPSPARVAAVAAVVKPQSSDAGEDEYTYGFRLWDAGFYPEARQQLKIFVRDYPDHRLVSYGRNLIGRAYLDDGDADQAAAWFVENYTSNKAGARAGDSVLYLAIAMIERGETERACTALGVFSREYASEAVGRLESLYDSTRDRVTCS
ncbi:tetratricopeptide repeat protein [Pseudoblastomonas halimionae]|uniref:Tetratricopeptide repeat protein n=1 Tax=Alteriqipengyuania halimionae TaxID=1926630 RepID=A0A6I4U7R4_9SPHN|nr:hypothetical protein [Alteriqipengyuania halimionae]MXP10482.1 hypothetical protein [Alteriqipengyuania halimionae]